MSCENTNARLQIKYTTIAGQVPTIPSTNDHNDGTWNPTDIYIGEFFLNSQDDLLWVRTLDGILAVGGTGGSASFIGDFVSKANGGTYSGPVFAPTFSAINMIATTISATAIDATIFGSTGSTYYGDGSNLTGITTNWNGGTVSDPTQFDNTVDFNQDISVSNVYPGTLGYIDIHSDIIVDGGLSASYFVGDGSLLTNLPIGPTANDYTTNAYLDGNIIRYDRTDLADAYSVDLTPILFTQSVASFGWDSATNDATITINDGSFFTINLGIFNNISTAIINATDVYATNFYGTFNGTFSNDIYTTSASLVGTTAVFDRTDGITYSLDLSTLSGGGSGSVGPTGATGSVGATGSQGYRAVMNLSYTGSSLTLGTGSITLPIGTPINNLGWQQGTRVRVWHSATEYMEGQVTTIIANPQTAGIDVNIDYVIGTGTFGQWYVGIAGDLGSSGAGGTLEQTLVIGNTTGTQSIYISSSASQIQGYNGINQHWYNAGAPFVGLGDYYQIENNSGGGETQSYIRFYDEGDTIIENNELYDTINSPANQDAKKTRLWLRPNVIRFNADNQDFDTNTLHLGSETTISADAFTHESTDYLNNCTAQIVATTDGTGTYTGITLQAYHEGGASASKIIVAHDYITNRVDASVGTGTGPFTNIEQTYTDIIVSGTPSFPGITYDRDYSANYTNRSLVDKEYVDGLAGGGTLEQTLVLGNTIGTQSINFGGTAYIQADGTNIELKADGNVSGDLYLNSLKVYDDTGFGPYGVEQISFSSVAGVDNTSSIELSPGQTYEAHVTNDFIGTQQNTSISRTPVKTVELLIDQSTGVDTEYRRELGVIGTTNGSSVKVTDNNTLEETEIKTDKSAITLSSSVFGTVSGQTLANIGITASEITYSITDTVYYDPHYSAIGTIGTQYTSFGNDYISPNPPFPDFHRRGSVNTKSGPASGNETWAELDSRTTDGSSFAFIRATDTGGAYPANVFQVGGSSGFYSQIEQKSSYITIEADNPAFQGILYDTDWSANFIARSLVDKGYVDAAVSGGPGATPSSLGDVLLVGNVATANIDLSGYDIQTVQTIDATNVEVTTIYADPTTGIETINMLNMSLLALMYNT